MDGATRDLMIAVTAFMLGGAFAGTRDSDMAKERIAVARAALNEPQELRVHISETGDAAWCSARLALLRDRQRQPDTSGSIRWFLEKRGDRWVVVEAHASIAPGRVASAAGSPGL